MRLTIKTSVCDYFIVEMLKVFLVSNSEKVTKKQFIEYMKSQIEMFGVSLESQFGENEYPCNKNVEFRVSKFKTKWFGIL